MTTALKGRPPVKAKNPEWERVGKTLQTLRERYGYSPLAIKRADEEPEQAAA
jgi:hypothetical protein